MTKLQALELAAGLSGLITGTENDLLRNIAEYMLAGKIDKEVSKWKIRKLAELGKLNKKNIQTIASYAAAQKELAELTVKRTAVDALKDAETGFRKAAVAGIVKDAPEGSMDRTMTAIINALGKQALSDLNLVNTTMLYKAKNAAGKAVRDAAELANKQESLDMLNKAAGKTVTAAESMTSAVSHCLKEMAEKGIPGFVDKAGREWTPEAYVNMCVRATVKNTGSKALFERMKDYDTHFIEITSHNGARPKCALDQGKIYDLNNGSGEIEDLNGGKVKYYPWSSTSYGKPDGILGINCGHFAYPFTPGYSLQRYFPYEKQENDALYKKVQKQRELEREVRASKRQCSMLKDGDPEEFKKASVKLKARTRKLKKYCEDNDLTYMNERTSVLGFGHSEAGKVTAAYRKALKEEEEKLRQIELDNLKNRAILKSKIESGELPLSINPDKQARHVLNQGETEKPDGRSFLTISEEEAQNIVNKYHASGTVKITNNGTQIKETINTDIAIGFSINKFTKEKTLTNKLTIHYSKNGTHIVPTYPDVEE